jgi:hypothetical protein
MSYREKPSRYVVAMLVLGCLAGCKGLFGSHGLPEDPLFVDRKPLESKADTARPAAPGWTEPAPPANPYAVQRLLPPESNLTAHPFGLGNRESEQAD